VTKLSRDDWFEIAHDLDWTLLYVRKDEAFPPTSHDPPAPRGEPFRLSYREYVHSQRETEAGIHDEKEPLILWETPVEAARAEFANRRIAWQLDTMAVRVASWDGFRDPDEMTNRKYHHQQDAAEALVDQALEDHPERRTTDREHGARWLDALGAVWTMQRYPVRGLKILATYLAQFAPSRPIACAAALQAADEVRRVERIAYRTAQLARAYPARGFGRRERETFETHPLWQPLREAIERMLVAFEWDEAFVALQLVIKPIYDEIFVHQLADVCEAAGDPVDALVLRSLWRDAERSRRWSAALVRFAMAQGDNRDAFAHHLARWSPWVDKLLRDGAEILATHGGGAATAIASAGEQSLRALHASAGIEI
jgi:toluene monooxygenase system protein E